MSLVSFIDSSQYRFVDSEAHCGGDQGKGQVSNNTDEGNVSDSQETYQNRSANYAGIPGIFPVKEGVHLVRTQPHLDGCWSSAITNSPKS